MILSVIIKMDGTVQVTTLVSRILLALITQQIQLIVLLNVQQATIALEVKVVIVL